jgi:hypothetical protein
MAKDDSATNTAIAVGFIGISAIMFFMFKDKIMAFIQSTRGGLDLGIGAGADLDQPTPEGVKPPPQLEEEEMESEEYYPLTDVIRYYANRVAEELDRYQGGDLTRTKKLNIEAYVLAHHKSEIQKIAKLQNFQILPLKGEAQARFSKLVLDIAPKVGVDRLPRNVKRRLRASFGHGDAGYTIPASDYIDANTRMRPN